MARAAHLIELNKRTKEAALAKKERDLARRRALAVRELYWTKADREQEEELLRAEIDQWIAEGRVTVCPPFGLKGDRADLKAAADVAHVMKNWVITDENDAAA
ncbi:MAG: hypothetical protein ACK4TJ_05825 [Tabrizicola sp.]